jgi:phage terminase large subunit-like protein
VNLDSYDACDRLPLDRVTLKGRPAWIGVDMANRFDIAAVCCCVRGADGVHYLFWRSFIPRDVDRAQVPPYDQFLAGKTLEATEGNTTS